MSLLPIVAVSLKAYFSPARANVYCHDLYQGITGLHADLTGRVSMAIFPSYLAVPDAIRILRGTGISVGVQDIAEGGRGPRTGEVPAEDAADLGVRLAEIGHAERLTTLRETPEMIQRKVAAAFASGLVPLLCIGEAGRRTEKEAASHCYEQIAHAVSPSTREIWLGYEPHWAIGASEPAPADYVGEVCDTLRRRVSDLIPNARILYGGSARPGLVDTLGDSVDGLFLGRFAHQAPRFFEVATELSRESRR